MSESSGSSTPSGSGESTGPGRPLDGVRVLEELLERSALATVVA
ncbi:MAG: hypothetical protein ABSA02_34910 [Trebonia sp.]